MPVCTHTIVINDQPSSEESTVLQIPWWFTFLLTYPGATTFLMYAQELKNKWACFITASTVTVSLTY